ncbi:hypothetical protein CcI49_20145 [Frankia sp. CcI49]|uniref:CaiB/BaiF CoA transferase family protein n=1 Tax=Frankia sp. CcI49 TaxID=1745382 RepID=UPI000977414B|nr:CoA transferase [Frankia sp. CcI49]ONH58745.1 hypothetical protein CcI49_20145 [Frankia sp. CcI49]
MTARHRHGPLAGVKVVDLSTALAGPWAAGILAGQGAEVIKVERPEGDQARWSGTRAGDISAMFHMVNRGKRGIVLDLRTAEGLAAAHRLVAGSDIVVQNFRPAVAERLGLAYEQLRAVNEDVIVVAVTGFGPTGPDADRPAFDSVIQAEAGFADLQAGADGVPRFSEHTIIDKITAMAAAQAAVTALFARERGLGGQLVEVPMLDVAVDFLWADVAGDETLLDAPREPSRGVTVGRRHFLQLADGWVTVSFGRPGAVGGLCRVLGLDLARYAGLAEEAGPGPGGARPRLLDAFLAEARAAARTLTRDEAARRLVDNDVTIGVVRTLAEMHRNPQLAGAGFFHETTQPGVGRIRHTVPPVRFGAFEPVVPGISPHLGEHTDEVLA